MDSRTSDKFAENSCVVCFKEPIAIFSIQDCEHVICYECSVRLRVLCNNLECPICRQKDTNAVLSSRRGSYRSLVGRCLWRDDRYRISFEDEDARRAFQQLVAHQCPLCGSRKTFGTFQQLRAHLSSAHGLQHCDLCVAHLKLFNKERRLYSRERLERHLRSGDGDESSYRHGHPLCQFCQTRYLDKDELYLHLRREHFYCHLCEADGHQFFYCTYHELQEHFRRDHFLCEEGDCNETKFIVFRTNIDLQAHRASVHNRGAQTRRRPVLTLQFSSENSRRRLPSDREPVTVRESLFEVPITYARPGRNRTGAQIRHRNRQEPALSASARPVLTSEAEFPALGSSRSEPAASSGSRAEFSTSAGVRTPVRTAVTISMGRRTAGAAPAHSPGSPVSPQPRIAQISSSGNITMQSPTMDHPPLFLGGRVVDDLEAAYPRPGGSTGGDRDIRRAAERHAEAGDERSSSWCHHRAGDASDGQASSGGASSPPQFPPYWLRGRHHTSSSGSDGKHDEAEGRDLNWNRYRDPGRESGGAGESAGGLETTYNGSETGYSADVSNGWASSLGRGDGAYLTDTTSSTTLSESGAGPAQLPAGELQLLTAQLAELPAQEELSVTRCGRYLKPELFESRNTKLVKMARDVLRSEEAFSTFRQVSADFRSGTISGQDYYQRCLSLLGQDGFGRIFPELLVLLPDVQKQTELLAAHDVLNSNGVRRNKFIACPTCSQVLIFGDFARHSTLHCQNGDLPAGW